MRVYTLALSIAAHVAGIAAIVVAPVIAGDTLPEPPRQTLWFTHMPIVVAPPPVAPPATQHVRPLDSPHGAPVDAPDGITPENAPPPSEAFDAAAPGDGLVPGAEELRGTLLPAPPPPPPAPIQRPPQPARVGGLITRPERVFYVPPAYPAIARAARIQGTVILEATVDAAGAVTDVHVLRSVQLLDDAAIEAVRQWRFMPTRLNGEPVPVVMTVTVTFTLQ